MTMPSTGPLNMGGTTSPVSVASELGLGLTSTISMNDTAVRNLAGVGGSGTSWSMSSLYGKSSGFSGTITSNQTNLNLRTWALANGWNGTTAATITVNAGVYIYSTATGTPGLTIDGSWPGGITLVNNGYIMGMGGYGGGNTTGYSIANGESGGNAISLGVNCSITNNSYIGGGGGGGGQGCTTSLGWYVGGGGGAGGGRAGGNYQTGSASAPAGGGPGSAGASASIGQVWTVTPDKYESYSMWTGGAGGRIMPGTGGVGGSGANVPGGGGSGGGGGLAYDNKSGDIATGGAGGSAGSAGSNGGYLTFTYGVGAGGGGGGGWGASGGVVGGSISPYTSGAGAGGKAIALNGYTATVTGSGTRYGATS